MHQKAEQNHQLHDYLVLLQTLQSLEQYREFYYQLYLLATINTDRAFTGHEQISELSGLIHSERLRNDNSLSFLVSNARIYDSDIGRFLSADTIIQDPHDSQAYNRYSYARNNPMMFTDPSGHSWWSKNESKIKNILIGVVVAILVVYTGGAILGLAGYGTIGAATAAGAYGAIVVAGAIGGAVGGFAAGMLNGATFDASLQMAGSGALYGGIGAGVASVIGSAWGASAGIGAKTGRALLHAMSRAAISKAQGGKWSAGFWSGFASSALGGQIASASSIEGQTAMAAIVGGTAAELGGGKFANGAVTGAFVHMYNYGGHVQQDKYWPKAEVMRGGGEQPAFMSEGGIIDISDIFLAPFRMIGSFFSGSSLMSTGKLVPTHGITMSKRKFRNLKTDIAENGIQESISYVKHNGTNYIVDGHHRFKAARQLGINSIPATRVSLPFRGYKTSMDF